MGVIQWHWNNGKKKGFQMRCKMVMWVLIGQGKKLFVHCYNFMQTCMCAARKERELLFRRTFSLSALTKKKFNFTDFSSTKKLNQIVIDLRL